MNIPAGLSERYAWTQQCQLWIFYILAYLCWCKVAVTVGGATRVLWCFWYLTFSEIRIWRVGCWVSRYEFCAWDVSASKFQHLYKCKSFAILCWWQYCLKRESPKSIIMFFHQWPDIQPSCGSNAPDFPIFILPIIRCKDSCSYMSNYIHTQMHFYMHFYTDTGREMLVWW